MEILKTNTETTAQKAERIERLGQNPEAWFAYYFPSFSTKEPAPFQVESTKRILDNDGLFLTRSWARGLGLDARILKETLYMILAIGRHKNIVLVSNDIKDAQAKLNIYKNTLEFNQRIIDDYGVQQSKQAWGTDAFVTKKGVSFTAMEIGQSPRGLRHVGSRPDMFIVDISDTEKELNDPIRIQNKVDWIVKDLLHSRSATRQVTFIACGQVLAKECSISKIAKRTRLHEIVNIRGTDGKSSWPSKISEKDIDKVFSALSAQDIDRHYFNSYYKGNEEEDGEEEIR